MSLPSLSVVDAASFAEAAQNPIAIVGVGPWLLRRMPSAEYPSRETSPPQPKNAGTSRNGSGAALSAITFPTSSVVTSSPTTKHSLGPSPATIVLLQVEHRGGAVTGDADAAARSGRFVAADGREAVQVRVPLREKIAPPAPRPVVSLAGVRRAAAAITPGDVIPGERAVCHEHLAGVIEDGAAQRGSAASVDVIRIAAEHAAAPGTAFAD